MMHFKSCCSVPPTSKLNKQHVHPLPLAHARQPPEHHRIPTPVFVSATSLPAAPAPKFFCLAAKSSSNPSPIHSFLHLSRNSRAPSADVFLPHAAGAGPISQSPASTSFLSCSRASTRPDYAVTSPDGETGHHNTAAHPSKPCFPPCSCSARIEVDSTGPNFGKLAKSAILTRSLLLLFE